MHGPKLDPTEPDYRRLGGEQLAGMDLAVGVQIVSGVHIACALCWRDLLVAGRLAAREDDRPLETHREHWMRHNRMCMGIHITWVQFAKTRGIGHQPTRIHVLGDHFGAFTDHDRIQRHDNSYSISYNNFLLDV